MASSALKIIALISMTLDHIAYHLIKSPNLYFIFRAIGRIAMPTFCFLIAQGYRYTSSRSKYFFRLFGFALFLELCLSLVYIFSGKNYMFRENIFLTLSAGLACLSLLNSKEKRFHIFGFLLFMIVAYLKIEYGIYGILLILLFGFTESFTLYFCGLFIINYIFIDLIPLLSIPTALNFTQIQWFSMSSLIGIYFYNHLPGKGNKLFFYLYYPAHIIIIIAIKELLL